MQWRHKDLLDVSQLSLDEARFVLDTARYFQEINSRPVKKVPTLKGRSVVLFFAEPSTRTKTSFDPSRAAPCRRARASRTRP